MAAAGRKQDYDYLIKLLLIGDSGECLYCDAQLRPEYGKAIGLDTETHPSQMRTERPTLRTRLDRQALQGSGKAVCF